MNLKPGGHKLGAAPLIAGVLTDADVRSLDPAALAPLDIIELRIDMFESLDLLHIAETFKAARERFGKPLLATPRDVREGGEKVIGDRMAVYRTVVPLSEVVDVEIMAGETMREVKPLTVRHGSLLIGSYHNFDSTPDEKTLDEIFARGRERGADIVKIAAMAKSREDALRLLMFTFRHRDEGVIALSMGDAGLASRVIGPLFGSLVTYGFVTRPSAPGQISAVELSDLMRRLRIR